MNKGLIVVDMLNDFIKPDGALYCGKSAEDIVQRVKNKVEGYKDSKYVVIYLADQHTEDDEEFKKFPKHCIKGTEGAEIISELNADPDVDIVIRKTRYSGFYGTALGQFLKLCNIKSVEVAGVCTSVCVMDTVGGLVYRNYPVTIDSKCIADPNQEMHEMALKRMIDIYGVTII